MLATLGLTVLTHAASPPPKMIDVDRAALPKAERIATPPVRTLLGYTRRLLRLPDGHTIGAFSYSNSAPANWLFLIDGRDLSSKRFAMPNNDIGSHGAALGTDGNIYVMPYGSPRAYRFDVARETFEPIDVPGLPPGEYTWDAIGAADGCIYFGTYPHAYLGRYEIATGKTRLWPNVAPKTTYVSHMEADGEGVRFRAWGPDQVWMRIDATMDEPVRVDAPATAPAKPKEGLPEPVWVERVRDAEVTIGHFGSLKRKDQNLTSLAYDPKHKLVWGGTNRWGQMRSAPPTQESAVVYAFDPESRKVVATLTPTKGADHLTILGCADDGTVVARSGDGIVMIDGATREIAHRGGWPVEPAAMRRGADGHQYFLADGHLWRWSITDDAVVPIVPLTNAPFSPSPHQDCGCSRTPRPCTGFDPRDELQQAATTAAVMATRVEPPQPLLPA